jgi:hypothetical protein
METKSLIIDARNSLILPIAPDRLTFDNVIDLDESEKTGKSEYELVEAAFARNYDMSPLLTRRYLGDVGIASAYILTPGVAKSPIRNFSWRRREIDQVTKTVLETPAELDSNDVEIYHRFLTLQQNGEFRLPQSEQSNISS